jgi:hypothetical protein
MEINRTSHRGLPLENSQRSESSTSEFSKSSSVTKDSTVETGAPVNGLQELTKADLGDVTKRKEVTNDSLSKLIDHAGEQMGTSLTDSQKNDLLEFLQSDPVMSKKLFDYLDQIAK